jgi:DNA modification methylase
MSGVRLIRGDARRLPLADKSVHMCVTSPPYWGLRDYQTGRWEGGDEGCDHRQVRPPAASSTLRLDGREHIGPYEDETTPLLSRQPYRDTCGKCGARRVDHQIGLERTPDEFCRTMVEVFREVRRVLRDDGTCWINLGDSYAIRAQNRSSDWLARHPTGNTGFHTNVQSKDVFEGREYPPDLKPKDLCGIPWRVALALQADGWYLRSDIIWAKPNPMPESVTDRPTKSHEYLFLLSKGERYYYDAEGIKEDAMQVGGGAGLKGRGDAARDPATRTDYYRGPRYDPPTRNLRSVWSIPTESFAGAHFATFPRRLVEPCIKAGTSGRGCCPGCGAGWEREVERERLAPAAPSGMREIGRWAERQQSGVGERCVTHAIGWRPGCSCFGHFVEVDDEPDNPYARPRRVYVPDGPQPDPVPAVILDPFAGSGTTLVVASALGRSGIGIDLSPDYLALARRRIERPHAPVPRPERDEVLPLFAGMAE